MAAGCGDNPDVNVTTVPAATTGGGPTTTVIDTIAVTPATATIDVGETLLFQATALDSGGTQITGVAFTWASSSPTVALIDANGLATGLVPGTTNITASSGGVTSNTAVLTVDCAGIPASFNNATAIPSTISTFGTSSISVEVADCNGGPVPNGIQVDFSTSLSFGTVTTPGLTAQQGLPPAAVATATFTAGSVGGTATVTITSGNATPSSVTIVIVPPAAGSIEFVSATPTVIGIKGSGQPETSTITFLYCWF